MTTEELNRWIAVNVFGWKPCKEMEYPFRAAYEKPDGEIILELDSPSWATDAEAVMEVFKKCAERTSVAINRGSTGFWISDCDKKSNYAVAETLELAICQFAQKLFAKS